MKEKRFFTGYADKENLDFLKAYSKAWGMPFNSYISSMVDDRVKELQSDMIEDETRLNIIKEEFKKNQSKND